MTSTTTIRHWLLALIGGVLLSIDVGCGSFSPPEAGPYPFPAPDQRTLSPTPELMEKVSRQVERWNYVRGCAETTPCAFKIEEGGIPVEAVDVIEAAPYGFVDANPSGVVYPNDQGLYTLMNISREYSSEYWDQTIAHEMGHLLGLGHLPTGIMYTTNKRLRTYEEALAVEVWTINEATLIEACSISTCLDFKPEAPHGHSQHDSEKRSALHREVFTQRIPLH